MNYPRQSKLHLGLLHRASTAAVAVSLLGGVLVSIEMKSVPTASAKALYVSDPASLVNTFVGTEDNGDTFPGADVPFGMVQWSPDTPSRPDGGGYSYSDSSIIGYSLTHLSGPGCQAEGDVPILPTTGSIGDDPAGATEPLVHNDETATPGYYKLDAGGVTTQLTATTRSGMATFEFPTTASVGNLLFKMSDSAATVTSSQFDVVNHKEVSGSVTSGFFCGASNTYTLHFDMVFNRAFKTSGSWTTGGSGDYVSFDTSSNQVVKAKVGISYVSTADAVLNRTVENPHWTFDSVKAAAEQSWETMLSKVRIGGGTTTQETIFYTSLYHSLLEPSVFSDVNGRYTGYDGKVHKVATPQIAQYANYSGWDIYRSEVQLEAILAPQQTSDIVTSMLNDYAETGQLPKWSEDDGESYIMVGDPADSIIADAYAFGARTFDAKQALTDMEKQATVPSKIRPGLDDYETEGYLPIDGTYGCCNFYGPVSTQEEYDTADNSIALLAAQLGDAKVAKDFAVRAQNWQNVFNPGSGFMEPKEIAGQFQPGFDPTSGVGFVEADSYVYTGMVPFDLSGLIAAAGGNSAWTSYLNALTSSVTSMAASKIQMGDEPSFDIPWEYDYAGDPSGTQSVVRDIQDQLFSDTPAGLPGNDDLGAMSSWYVWSAILGYPETPGSETVAIGSPLFTAISIQLADGRSITETAPAAASDAPYIHHLILDQKAWHRAYLPPSIFSDGASLDWTLSTKPDTSWGAGAADAPPSDTQGLLPALGYLGDVNGDVMVAPGGTATVALGAQSLSVASQQIGWTASAESGSGIQVLPANGTIAVEPESKSTVPVTIQVASSTPAGQYLVRFALRSETGKALPDVVVELDVT